MQPTPDSRPSFAPPVVEGHDAAPAPWLASAMAVVGQKPQARETVLDCFDDACLAFDSALDLAEAAWSIALQQNNRKAIQTITQQFIMAAQPFNALCAMVGDPFEATERGWGEEDLDRVCDREMRSRTALDSYFVSLPDTEADLARDLFRTQWALRRPDASGRTTLSRMAFRNKASILPFCLESDDPNASDKDDMTALHWAAQAGALEAVRVLAPLSDMTLSNRFLETALMRAINMRQSECAKFLAPLSDLGARDGLGQTPFLLACARGDAALIDFLAPLSDTRATNQDGEDGLMLASAAGAVECLPALLALCDTEREDNTGDNALHAAARAGAPGSPACIAALIAAGFNPSQRTRSASWTPTFMLTPLTLAVESANLATVEALTPHITAAEWDFKPEGNFLAPATALATAATLGAWPQFDALAPWFPKEQVFEWLQKAPPGAAPMALALYEEDALRQTLQSGGAGHNAENDSKKQRAGSAPSKIPSRRV